MITYTDVVGTLMSSVTDIIDIISYVLIAFVAISLVVSSIMIELSPISVCWRERRRSESSGRSGHPREIFPRCSTQRPLSSVCARD